MIQPQQECFYCTEHFTHDGKCTGNRKSYFIPCLGFKLDHRGTIKHTDTKLTLYINHPIPPLNEWSEDYEIDENDYPLKFTKIVPKKWVTDRVIAVECEASFYYFDDSGLKGDGEKQLAEVIPLRRRSGNNA